ncbi:putative ste23 [Botrytis fragariae]|uniref:Putative ste23 n=1 Tax=Botrytis fragariae TaxID=1964551 RepID=A0A8H6EK64_9HELO|nr:putative ste23 [Botrytis fragariae]KAF5874845.1 putative ste23 [Botrytis fragariae]
MSDCSLTSSERYVRTDGKFEGEILFDVDIPQKPFEREFSFRTSKGQAIMPGLCRLDSGSDIPLVVSRRWVKEAGKEAEISTDFECPSSYSLSGHAMEFTGIIRNFVFNPKGSSTIYRRDFLVCDQLDSFVDFTIGEKFMLEEWQVLFGNMKRRIAGWFSHKKETPLEQEEAQILKDNQEKEAQEAELRRQDKKDAQRKKEKEARQKWSEANESPVSQ